MKIISRYVIREHVGPLAFAATALTSLMLLNYIAKNFGNLVGKGLPARVIVEFFALAVPFTVAMTLPMAVLVAVLYAFSRLASENEITAFKASGVSMRRLMRPALWGGLLFSLIMLGFNDQLLPRANHRLAQLQRDIIRTSPTFALKEQVVNPIKEGQLYLRAGRIARGSGRMREVVLYDLTDPIRRRTIYADSGHMGLAPNQRDLYMTLYDGVMREIPNDKPEEITQLHYGQDRIRVRNVTNSFEETEGSGIKGEREMSVCEMQERLAEQDFRYQRARHELRLAIADSVRGTLRTTAPPALVPRKPRGIGYWYCEAQKGAVELVGRGAVALVQPREAHASEPPRWQQPQQQQPPPQQRPPAQDTLRRRDTARASVDTARARRDSALARQDSLFQAQRDSARRDSITRAQVDSQLAATQDALWLQRRGGQNPLQSPGAAPGTPAPGTPAPGAPMPGVGGTTAAVAPGAAYQPPPPPVYSRVKEAREQIELARQARNKYDVEIHKKFSLAAACFIFVLIGAPLALRFPRGGVGMVIGVSLAIFAISYVGLIGGEALADKALLEPAIAMWAANIILFLIGLALTLRMGRENTSGRGGGLREWFGGLRPRRRARSGDVLRTA
ncbi:MAG TPA: LptF/LptG family permease [Gemmatimonadaceae bacterium]|nr:LptF/LptG family permease [Gemmatimonadaceae bacterium]